MLENRKTFTVAEDTRTHDENGRGLEMGFYWVRCLVDGRYSGGTRYRPDDAYETACRLLEDGWAPHDEATREFVEGMRNVERAFEADAARAHLYDAQGRLKPIRKRQAPADEIAS